jgi:hypothetical protein
MLPQVAVQPVLHGLYRYWNQKRGARPMPDRADIDPLEIDRAILPHVMLLELIGPRVRYRLIGTEVAKRSGLDPTGKYVDEVLRGSYLDHANALFDRLRAEAVPLYSESQFRWDIASHLRARRIFLPLGWRGASPGMALSAQLFETLSGPAGRPITEVIEVAAHESVIALVD